MAQGVYSIKNQVNGKVYIGSSRNIDKRFYNHKYRLKNGCHHSPKLQEAWDEYGESAFVFCLLQEIEDPEDLIKVEQQFMDLYKAWDGYNVQDKASRSGIENLTNPRHCDRPMAKNGFQKVSGAQQYRCKCGFTATEGDRPSHRPSIGDRAMTQLERDQKYRLKHPEKYKQIHKKGKK